MYSRKVDCEIFYDRRESIGSTKSAFSSDYGSSRNDSPSSLIDHYNPSLRLLQIPRSSYGSMGFHLTRSKWDPYPWISAVDKNTPAKFHGLKAGDCVLEVNGEDILGMRVSEIADLVNSETKSFDSVSLLLWSPGSDINCNPSNLCCGPMPLNLERLTAFTQTILAIIECPVCLETIAPPILQCQNGHILCVKCRILSHICPVCRQHFYPGRSLVAEQIYNSIMGTFNLRSPDKLQGHDGQLLFGARYKRSSSISMLTTSSSSSSIKDERRQRRRHECECEYKREQNNGIRLKPPPREVNKFESLQPSTNKFLAKLLGRAYSMDNLSSSHRRQSAPLLSMTRITIGRVADDTIGGKDIDNYSFDEDDKAICIRTPAAAVGDATDSNEQLKLRNPCKPVGLKPRPASISKQFSLSADDLSKKDNDELIAVEQKCLSKNRLEYLWLEQNAVQMALLPIFRLLPALPSHPLPKPQPPPPSASTAEGRRQISDGGVKNLKDEVPTNPTIQIPFCEEQSVFHCPFSCGKQFSGRTLQQHITVDHCAPILCYSSSSAELALPLRAPLDKAAVLLMCDGKDFWIKLRTHGKGKITALALFQGPEDESSDFIMETRISNQNGKDQEDIEYHEDGHVIIVVNNDDKILQQRELITRSIVRSMNVTTWEGACACAYAGCNCSGDLKCSDFLYNDEDIRMAFGDAIEHLNLSLTINIKKR